MRNISIMNVGNGGFMVVDFDKGRSIAAFTNGRDLLKWMGENIETEADDIKVDGSKDIGWVDYNDRVRPVNNLDMVEYVLQSGDSGRCRADALIWSYSRESPSAIVRYRVLKP